MVCGIYTLFFKHFSVYHIIYIIYTSIYDIYIYIKKEYENVIYKFKTISLIKGPVN